MEHFISPNGNLCPIKPKNNDREGIERSMRGYVVGDCLGLNTLPLSAGRGVAARSRGQAGTLRERAKQALFIVAQFILPLQRQRVRGRSVLYPCYERIPHSSWLPADTASAVGQPRNLEDAVKFLSLWVKLQDFIVVVCRLLQGN